MKKIATCLTMAGFLLCLSTAAGAKVQQTNPPLCPVNGCQRTADHAHQGGYYAGHHLEDGHAHHIVCDREGCDKTGSHYHDGVLHMAYEKDGGHVQHAKGHGGRHHR